jgi:excinuclease ABC subunit A
LNDSIIIRGARVHNLKGISLAIPHDRLTVVTGVSGSGKSSLAFDTIYAEGQRRYVERCRLTRASFWSGWKPDVDEIDGIAPPVAIRQKNTTRNPRSTVATSTELYDFLRSCGRARGERSAQLRNLSNATTSISRGQDDGEARRLALYALFRWFSTNCIREAPVSDGENDRGPARPAVRLRNADLPVPGRQDLRILDARVAAGSGFHQAGIHSGGLPGDLARCTRLVDAVEIGYRESGEMLFEPAGGARPFASTRSSLANSAAKNSKSLSRACLSSIAPLVPASAARFGNTIDYDLTW